MGYQNKHEESIVKEWSLDRGFLKWSLGFLQKTVGVVPLSCQR